MCQSRFLLNKLAAAGRIDDLTAIGGKLSTELKRLVSFDNRLCHANIVAGNVEDYLKKLEDNIENATDANLEDISSQFPRGGAFGILEKYPEYLDKCECKILSFSTFPLFIIFQLNKLLLSMQTRE